MEKHEEEHCTSASTALAEANLLMTTLTEAHGEDGRGQLLLVQLLLPVGVEELEHLPYQPPLRLAAPHDNGSVGRSGGRT